MHDCSGAQPSIRMAQEANKIARQGKVSELDMPGGLISWYHRIKRLEVHGDVNMGEWLDTTHNANTYVSSRRRRFSKPIIKSPAAAVDADNSSTTGRHT